MKFLLLLLVVAFALWLLKTKGRAAPPTSRRPDAPPTPKAPPQPATMLACVHCGVHLPQADTVQDAAGRAYCSEAHRLAGPR
jgi:uncharacterized protein